MTIRNLLCLVCALSGCTLTLTGEPIEDEAYVDSYDDASRPVARSWDRERVTTPAPVTTVDLDEPTFVPPDAELEDEAPLHLRDLTLRMTGMDEEVDRFMKVRIASRDNRYVAIGILHQGIPSSDYTFELPAVLRDGLAYTLTLFADTDDSGGYSAPPADHAWSIPIPAGYDDVTIDFEAHEGYVDIERDAPEPAQSLVVTFHDMQEYYKHPLDVRVIERATGRLVGRHVRQVPGDSFDLTIGGVIHAGVQYQVDVAVDIDEDGYYDPIIDDSWRVTGTADRKGLAMRFVPNGPYVDVGF